MFRGVAWRGVAWLGLVFVVGWRKLLRAVGACLPGSTSIAKLPQQDVTA